MSIKNKNDNSGFSFYSVSFDSAYSPFEIVASTGNGQSKPFLSFLIYIFFWMLKKTVYCTRYNQMSSSLP